MLMWEVSSGQSPFANFEHDYYLAIRIINGMRPKIVPGTPLKYEELMKQCWEYSPKRLDTNTLLNKIFEIIKYYQQTDEVYEKLEFEDYEGYECDKIRYNIGITRVCEN